MSQLFLPVEHTEADLVLAGQIAEWIESAELYVVWTPESGQALPEVAALLRDPPPHWADTLALLFGAVRELWTVLLGREEGSAIPRDAAASATAPAARPATGEAAA